MADYYYRVLDKEGEVQTGVMDASDVAGASAELYRRGSVPLEISLGKKTLAMRLNEPVTLFNKPGQREVFAFLRDLSRLLRAGLAIDDSFKLLFDMQEKELFLRVLEDMRERLRRGEALAAAMAEHKGLFLIQVVASVHAGELSGTLPQALEAISASMEKALSFKDRLRSAMIYPAILMMMVVGTFVLVLTFVLPQFAPIFEGNEDKLPFVTKLVMSTAAGFRDYFWLVVTIAAGLLSGAFWVSYDAQAKAALLRRICKIPILKDWLLTPDVIRFVRTLGVCCKSGIALDKAIAMAIESVKMPHLGEDLAHARVMVRRGDLLSVALKGLGWFPPLALQFARVGEQSGNLGLMLEEAATIMVQDFEARLEKALEVLSPVLTLVMGGIVALLLGSVLLGIMSINDVVL